MSLCGIPHVTLSPAALQVLALTPFDQHYKDLRDRALIKAEATTTNKSLEQALEQEPVKSLQADALARFTKAEMELVEMARTLL